MATTEQAPDYMEPLIGWRYWWLNPWAESIHANGFYSVIFPATSADSPVLHSMVMQGPCIPAPTVWPNDGPFVAECRCQAIGLSRGVQQGTCSMAPSDSGIGAGYFPCGIYAWRCHELLLQALKAGSYYTDAFVFGAVRLWGVVRPHVDGYRAQYAYPDRIIYAAAGHRMGQAIADHYRIPYDCDKEVEREYRRAETHHYRRTGQVPNSGGFAYACDDPNCTICTNTDAYNRRGMIHVRLPAQYLQYLQNQQQQSQLPSAQNLAAPQYWYQQQWKDQKR